MTARAALSEPESYGWVHFVAASYVLVVCVFSVLAWAQDSEYLRAAMCAGAQGLAIVCAILARRAYTGEMPWMGHLMVLFSGGCAYWSALGIQHAWGADANMLMVGFLAALEPLLFLAAEHIKEGREALREQAKRDAEELRQELERNRQQRDLRLATSGGVAVATLAQTASAAVLPEQIAPTAPERPAIVSTDTGHATARDHVIALKRSNPRQSNASIARRLGVPQSTANYWIKTDLPDLHPVACSS